MTTVVYTSIFEKTGHNTKILELKTSTHIGCDNAQFFFLLWFSYGCPNFAPPPPVALPCPDHPIAHYHGSFTHVP